MEDTTQDWEKDKMGELEWRFGLYRGNESKDLDTSGVVLVPEIEKKQLNLK